MNNCELMIKPKNRKQQQELNRYIKHLKLTTKGEIFILNCVLYFDWSKQKIISSIEKIKESEDGKFIDFKISMTAPRITTNYCTSNPYNGIGWTKEYADSLEKRMFNIYHKMDYYTNR